MLKLMVYATLVATVVASVIFVFGMLGANSAPQEAAISAMALAIAVIPYVFMRALQLGHQMDNEEIRHKEIMDALKELKSR